eukprot:TRINITY_DN55662_c0_g1_i1.p1 TRINITY_DN55662_c0_g1~~TRINITY_DN55662_c0_g1_i1.p1  ORF type:complete len:364 (-),score=69.37 TRINITY_DN55662_c0_g1_i1:29-1120(-)
MPRPALDISQTNMANFGTELEKNIKLAAAQHEAQWAVAGKEPGLQIWRIEKFHVVPWPTEEYGSFFDGDSYILLKTRLAQDKLEWDIHFWLGTFTTQDEAGTAAYKTVELDDFLGGGPVQHREVQGFESSEFLSYFAQPIQILAGGIESGFRHVEPEKYVPRLLQVKGRGKKVVVREVEKSGESLNAGDVFLLDLGRRILQWTGKDANPFEKAKGGEVARLLADDHKGKVEIVEQGRESEFFWEALGGRTATKPASEGGDDAKAQERPKTLLKLSDAGGSLEFTEIARGNPTKDLLNDHDVFVLDTGLEVFIWVAQGASEAERRGGLQHAQEYLAKSALPPQTPICCMRQGHESLTFRQLMNL